jgi:hypothetical protein
MKCTWRRRVLLTSIAHTIFILLQGVFSSASEADDLASLETDRLINARSLGQLRATVALKNELSLARATCESELRAGGVPAACFQTIGLEEREKLLSATQAVRSKELITETCRTRVSRVSSLEMLESWLASPWLTVHCREAVRARASEVQYMAVGQSPELLFRRRFR